MKIIMLSGKKGSGKSTIADLLLGYERMSFATPIKNAASAIFTDTPYVAAKKGQVIRELNGITMREVLQNLGQGIREFEPGFWANHMLMRMKLSHGAKFVIDDWRYPNEARILQDAGASICTVRITVNNDEGHTDKHSTEIALDDFDFDLRIENNCHMAVGEHGPFIEYVKEPVEIAAEILEVVDATL